MLNSPVGLGTTVLDSTNYRTFLSSWEVGLDITVPGRGFWKRWRGRRDFMEIRKWVRATWKGTLAARLRKCKGPEARARLVCSLRGQWQEQRLNGVGLVGIVSAHSGFYSEDTGQHQVGKGSEHSTDMTSFYLRGSLCFPGGQGLV